LKSNGFCELNCLSNQYNDNSQNLCFNCDASCLGCTKGGIYGCSSCPPNKSLRFDGLCVPNCGPGFFFQQTLNQCFACHQTCLTCSGPSDLECIQCKSGLLVQIDGSCKADCPPRTFVSSNVRCLSCHLTCQSCSGSESNQCLTCIPGLYLSSDFRCDTNFPAGHFLSSTNQLLACHATCKTCSGASQTDCLTCHTPETTRLSTLNSCVDCKTQYLQNKDVCWFVVQLRIAQPGFKSINQMASASWKLTFDGESRFAGKLTLESLKQAVQLSVSDILPGDYTAELVRREGDFIIDLFFKATRATPVTLTVTPTKEVVLIDLATGYPDLIFLSQSATQVVSVKEAPNAQTMESMASFNEASQGPVAAISTAASFFSMVSMVATTPLMAPFLKFLKIFKLISRLKLINVFFGPFLEFVLMMSGMMFPMGNDPRDLRFLQYDSSTRGKLSKYHIMTVSVETMWVKYMVYYVVLLIRVYQAKIRVYIKQRRAFSVEDQIVDRIADESRIILFTMVVIDILFYSMRCVCHMNLDIPQSRDSNISYALSAITIIAVSVDVFLLFLSNKRMDIGKILRARAETLQREKNDRIRKKRLEMFKAGTPFKREEASGDAPEQVSPVIENESPNGQIENGSKTHKRKAVKENESQAAVIFFTEGIKTEEIKNAKYFNSISLIKLIVVEPFYVTLQLFPTIQVVALFALQAAYFAYFCNFAFKKRVFSDKSNVVQIFVNECALTCFLLIGSIFQIGGGYDSFSSSAANGLQIVGIVMLAISCLMGAGILLYSICAMVVGFVRTWQKKKRLQEYNKTYQVKSADQENEAAQPNEGREDSKVNEEKEIGDSKGVERAPIEGTKKNVVIRPTNEVQPSLKNGKKLKNRKILANLSVGKEL
jgi:hypothetical protein